MGKENLVKFTDMTPAEQHAIRSKGGKTMTDKKRMAYKLREIKKRVKKGQLKTSDEEWLLERVTNPESFALDLVTLYDELRGNLPPDKLAPVLSAGDKLYKSFHGDKKIIESRNINLNLDVPFSQEEVDDLLESIN